MSLKLKNNNDVDSSCCKVVVYSRLLLLFYLVLFILSRKEKGVLRSFSFVCLLLFFVLFCFGKAFIRWCLKYESPKTWRLAGAPSLETSRSFVANPNSWNIPKIVERKKKLEKKLSNCLHIFAADNDEQRVTVKTGGWVMPGSLSSTPRPLGCSSVVTEQNNQGTIKRDNRRVQSNILFNIRVTTLFICF